MESSEIGPVTMLFELNFGRVLAVGHLCVKQPAIVPKVASLRRAVLNEPEAPQAILVGTHHKCLTVFLSQIFKAFSVLTGKSFSSGRGRYLDYSKYILFDHHSEFDFGKLNSTFCGVHVRRDPRDVLVSAAFYHLTAKEKWLHEEYSGFPGKTYQEIVNSFPSFEEVLLFELNHAAGDVINTMVTWNYEDDRFCEFSYEELISSGGMEVFITRVSGRFPESYTNLMGLLFELFAYNGPLARRTHIRNPSSGQWKKHFTPRVHDAFNERFGEGLARLGYG
jgi:hypothetical protein